MVKFIGIGKAPVGARWARRLVLCLLVLMLSGAIWVLLCEQRNSRDVPFPTDTELRSSFSRAGAWVLSNRDSVLSENNSMLWLFVREAGRLSNDPRLASLAEQFQARYTRGTLSQLFFDASGIDRVRDMEIDLSDSWQGYQRLFVYGATCNRSMRSDPQVQALLSPSACESGHEWLRFPWCRTHQLMGLRFVQRNHCEPDEETARTIKTIQDLIVTELKWDFRVQDAYLQRVWTLVESGRRDEIKAIWLRRILSAQRADGGWDGADIIARLPGGLVVCWQGGNLYPHLRHMPASDFHATAQGLYLMALLLNGERTRSAL
jgi:hypothetical protein